MKLHKKKALRQMNGLGKGGLEEKETDGRLNAAQLKATPRLKAATETADGLAVRSAMKSSHTFVQLVPQYDGSYNIAYKQTASNNYGTLLSSEL